MVLSVAAFLGIPFAADTAYQNRWKPPQPREPWNETYQATSFGPACPSIYASSSSEDCLSLNLWTSANSTSDNLPVVVWSQGSDQANNEAIYYGGGLALKGVIGITFNRRDDAFGFLAHPELNQEGLETFSHETSRNYGILDHLEVLKWVQKNIANFGGDPDRVTVAGQSFGSSQAYHAINSPLFTGSFHGAIAESGIRWPYDTLLAGLATSYVNMSRALEHGVNYTTQHNVSTIAELRTLSMEDLLIGSQDRVGTADIWWVTALSAQYPLIFKPVLDGYALPEKYIDSLLNGPANDVPVITGNNKDESGAATTTNFTTAEYKVYCTLKYGNLSSKYFLLCPGNNDTEVDRSWNAAARDTSVVGLWLFADAWIKSASSPFYTYYWDHAPPNQTEGAYHQSEIYYIMNSLYASADSYSWTWYDYYIGDMMSGYWANFIKTGNPNIGGSFKNGILPYWPANNGTGQFVHHIGDRFGGMSIAKPDQVEFIKEYFAQQTPY
ncbi:Carboxylesterase type B protein [Rutstroemia sp. NJR-2017a BVV2]|nr:Carboxylesterase type B protein [Rutstroemia sp. NJR-2017a BVV2]